MEGLGAHEARKIGSCSVETHVTAHQLDFDIWFYGRKGARSSTHVNMRSLKHSLCPTYSTPSDGRGYGSRQPLGWLWSGATYLGVW